MFRTMLCGATCAAVFDMSDIPVCVLLALLICLVSIWMVNSVLSQVTVSIDYMSGIAIECIKVSVDFPSLWNMARKAVILS